MMKDIQVTVDEHSGQWDIVITASDGSSSHEWFLDSEEAARHVQNVMDIMARQITS